MARVFLYLKFWSKIRVFLIYEMVTCILPLELYLRHE